MKAENQENSWSEQLMFCLILKLGSCCLQGISASAWASLLYVSEFFIFHCVQTSGLTVSSDPLDACCCLVIENAPWWSWLLNCHTVKVWAVQCSCVTGNIVCLFVCLKADYDFLEWTRNFHQQGTRTCLCPGTASWNRLVSEHWKENCHVKDWLIVGHNFIFKISYSMTGITCRLVFSCVSASRLCQCQNLPWFLWWEGGRESGCVRACVPMCKCGK